MDNSGDKLSRTWQGHRGNWYRSAQLGTKRPTDWGRREGKATHSRQDKGVRALCRAQLGGFFSRRQQGTVYMLTKFSVPW